MQLTQMNVWGAAMLLLLTAAVAVLFWLLDRRSGERLCRVAGLGAVQLGLLGAVLWTLHRLHAWWADLLWLLFVAVGAAWLLRKKVGQTKPDITAWPAEASALLSPKGLVALSAALAVACGVMAACLSWCLPGRVFVPAAGVLMGCCYYAGRQWLMAYTGSLRHTEDHRRFLLANGASRVEALLPSVRRAMRAAAVGCQRSMAAPLLVAMPVLTGGLLIAGAEPSAAVAVTLLLAFASLTTPLLSAVLAIVFLTVQLSSIISKSFSTKRGTA